MSTLSEARPELTVHIDGDPLVRLESLVDEGTLRLAQSPDGSGVAAGVGSIDGTMVAAFATDPRLKGGALGGAGCASIVAAYQTALRAGMPVIGIWESGGARLGEGAASLHAVGTIFAVMTRASGVIPQISVVLGPAAGGAAYGPALTDLIVLSARGRIFVTGPDIVRAVTGQETDMAQLGGPEPHGRKSGVANLVTDTDAAALMHARDLAVLTGSPRTAVTMPQPVCPADPGSLLPDSPRRAYDVHALVNSILDTHGIELQPQWAPNVVTVLGRLGGRTVGVVANNPLRLAGCLDSKASEKAARFVRMCDALGIALVVLVDVPGYLPGADQEWNGVVRRGAKLVHAFAEATVPRFTVITRKAYGGAFIAMNSRSLGATRVFAWPTAEVGVMGAAAAVNILHRRRLSAAPPGEREELAQSLASEYENNLGGLERACTLGIVDEIIEPAYTRMLLAQVLADTPTSRGRHKNIPL